MNFEIERFRPLRACSVERMILHYMRRTTPPSCFPLPDHRPFAAVVGERKGCVIGQVA